MSHLILAGTYVPFGTGKNTLNSGDTAWVLASSALVLLMTPALAFFYGGMVRVKHVLAMLMQNFAAIAIVSVTWVIVGFTWAFGGDGPWLGDLHFFGLQNMNDVVPTLGRGADHADDGDRGVPVDVRDHHAGADHRLDR